MTEIGKHKHRKRNPRGAASPTSRRRLEARQKELQALQLRIGGASWEQIAQTLGFANRSGPFHAVDRLLRQLPVESINQLRNLQRERLNGLWLGSWPAASKGDPQAVANCMRILKRAAELDGLDAPKKLEHAGPSGQSIPIKHENVSPLEYVGSFKVFVDAVLGQGVARVREDGTLEPMDHHNGGQPRQDPKEPSPGDTWAKDRTTARRPDQLPVMPQ